MLDFLAADLLLPEVRIPTTALSELGLWPFAPGASTDGAAIGVTAVMTMTGWTRAHEIAATAANAPSTRFGRTKRGATNNTRFGRTIPASVVRRCSECGSWR